MTNFGATDPRSVELMREALRELYGLEGSLLEQYLNFWGRVVTRRLRAVAVGVPDAGDVADQPPRCPGRSGC